MSDYREGYGQAKADMIRGLKAALDAVEDAYHPDRSTPMPEGARERLRAQKEALRWARAIVKSLEAPR